VNRVRVIPVTLYMAQRGSSGFGSVAKFGERQFWYVRDSCRSLRPIHSKGRHFPGELILLCVRWYVRYPLAYQHVAEMVRERGVEVDASCIWRRVQVYVPELNKRCRPHLKPSNKSYRVDATYIKVKGQDKYLYRAVNSTGQTIDFC
jgi:transposase-like protein